MSTSNLIGTTLVWDDAYTGVEKYGRIDRMFGSDAIVRTITKEEAGPDPRRIAVRLDERIARITGGTGLIN